MHNGLAPSVMHTAPVAVYRMLHRASARETKEESAAGSPFFPRRRSYASAKGDVWELLGPETGAAPNELRFFFVVGRKYRLCLAQPRVGAAVHISAAVVVEGEAGQSTSRGAVPEPKLLQFEVDGTRAGRGQAAQAGEGATRCTQVETATMRFQPDGMADGGLGFASSTQALRGVWYELRVVYGDTGEPVCPVRLLIGTRTKAAPVCSAPPAPAPTRHVLLPASAGLGLAGILPMVAAPTASTSSPPDTPSPSGFAATLGSPSSTLSSPSYTSPAAGRPPEALPPPPLPPLPPPLFGTMLQATSPAGGAKSGGPGRTHRLGGSGAKRAARRKEEREAAPGGDATAELVDPFSLLVIASKSVEATSSEASDQQARARPSSDAAGAVASRPSPEIRFVFMDGDLVGYLEFLFCKTRDLFSAGGTGLAGTAQAPDGQRAPRRLRRSSEAINDAEGLLRRIDNHVPQRTEPLDLRSPLAMEESGDELLRSVAGRPPPPICNSPEERRAFEDSVAEAIAAVEHSAAGDIGIKVDRLKVLLADGRLLSSRYIGTHSGVRELRRAFLALRAATRSVAAEQHIALELVQGAASAIIARVALPSAFLVEACERSWRLANALLPAVRGMVTDLPHVPHTQILSLALLAVQALEAVKGAEPMAYAAALFNHGYRLLQFYVYQQACAAFFAALATIRQHGLGPCLLEARTLACLTAALNRSNLYEEATKLEGLIYWYEDAETPDEKNAHRECLEVMLHLAGRRNDAQRILALTSELYGISQPASLEGMGADAELLMAWSLFSIALSNLHGRRLMDAIRVYREAVNLLASHPHVVASPAADLFGCWEGLFRTRAGPVRDPPMFAHESFDAAAVASGLRVAVAIHRLVDWSGRTPLLAHLLFALGRKYASAGERGKALATLVEAAAEYGRFGELFPSDHPRVLAVHKAADVCRGLLAPSGPAAPAAAAFRSERVHVH